MSRLLPMQSRLLLVVLAIPFFRFSEVSLAVGASKFQAVVHSNVLFGTQVIVGGVVSTSVTVWLQVAVLPQESVARQVRVATKVFPQKPTTLVAVPTTLIVTLPHVSLAVG